MPDFTALVRARLAPLDVDPAREADIVAELAQHVAEHHAELVASGVTDDTAIAMALAPLDDRQRVAAEIARADRPRVTVPEPPADGSSLAVDFWRDLRYAARVLLRAPGFAAIAVVTLALGIGANAAIFSVLGSVLLRPLPYADPARLVMIGEREADGTASNVGYATFLDWRDRSRGFEEMALIRSWQPTLTSNGEPERISAIRVSWNFFHMLGVRPALGRDFRADEDNPDRWRVLLISDRLWRRRFAADPSTVGRVVTMNDRDYTIVGVMPPTFEPLISERFYQPADMWGLVGYDVSLNYACRGCQHLKAIGRVKTPLETARADLDAVQSELRKQFPSEYPQATMTLVPLQEVLTGDIRPALLVLMGAVAFVLLIACANVANLLLARMARREHDLALRTALGASRARLVRQLLAENALLAGLGGAGGVLLAVIAVPLLTRVAPASMARLAGAHVDGRVVAFSALVSLGTALVFGLLPALRASRIDLRDSLHGDGRKTAHAPTSLARRLLVAADVALAVVLLVGAGLMIRSVDRLIGVNPGFDPDQVLTMQISMVGQAYEKDEAVVAKTDEMITKLRALPGVASVAAAGQIPLGGNGDRWGFHVQGRVVTPDDPSVERYSVTPEYFSVMRIPLRRGRLFTEADRAGAEQVMLVGERTARLLWPDADPIGQHVRIASADSGPWRTVVGIVGDVRHHELAAPPTMQMYTPQAQVTDSFLTFVIRTNGDPAALAGDARRSIWSVARDVPVYAVAPLADLVARSVGPRRFVMLLLECFGAVALLMTAVGLYGVIAYTVSERTREIGIRAALGASPSAIVRLVVGGGFAVVAVGLTAGVLVAAGATKHLQGSLYGISPTDPVTFAAVIGLLVLVTLAAQGIPIARAMRVDPAIALRQE
ncbi:MAG TPA: ABC transporter permease [Vicinamibacterales bacterium]|jgi:putative ABC transport system permease protein|nr:ABC transporter permease [Vicinamibacterales bacterium]